MQIEYWIKDEGKWRQVDCDTYHNFTEEKEIRPATWRLWFMQSLLQKYRYM